MRAIDADALIDRLKHDHELLLGLLKIEPIERKNHDFLQGAITYSEGVIEMIEKAPTITSEQKGGWFILEDSNGNRHKMRIDKDSWAVLAGEDTE